MVKFSVIYFLKIAVVLLVDPKNLIFLILKLDFLKSLFMIIL